jgi:hypothetical protein
MSARAEPTPPAKNPRSGAKVSDATITIASPTLKKPCVAGMGTWISCVDTHTSADIAAAVATSREPKRRMGRGGPPQNISLSNHVPVASRTHFKYANDRWVSDLR